MRPLHLAIDHQWYDGNKRKRSVVNTRSSLNKNRWLTHIEWTTKNRYSNQKEPEHEVRAEKKQLARGNEWVRARAYVTSWTTLD